MMEEVPIGSNGRPMCKITAGVMDKLPTVQYGSAHIGPVTMTRWIEDLGDGDEGRQYRIDQARLLQRDVEYVCGIERRLLQWAIDPASKVQSPITAEDAFAAPPAGYNGSSVADPRETAAGAPAPVQPEAPAATPPATLG